MIVAEGKNMPDEQVHDLYALQWGRNLIVAEGAGHHDPAGCSGASMGPQLDSCGRTDVKCAGALANRFNGAAT